ncbi:SIS domain-containing protein [Vagococcus sp. BWB3-3]|uniref:SIS domain-containing protein n=1 Tax=Vagococcus allomyrinae TaxID=2794353 RepID=A0A940P6H3_9ENTE|nr:SIS domain-containing protein [Vagococcus allomyrinae]MBP1042307.1 SIS domain-containing protein [Vagococcus allomyrinae]
MSNYQEYRQGVIEELNYLLEKVSVVETDDYLKALLAADQVFFIGVGRVKMALETAVKRFTHLGINCHMVGDLNEPPITKNDLLVVGSASGESLFPKGISIKAKELGAKIWHLTSNSESTIAKLADGIVTFQSPSKSSQAFTSIQPMTTVFEQGLMLYHDILSLELAEIKGLTFEDLKKQHANLE